LYLKITYHLKCLALIDSCKLHQDVDFSFLFWLTCYVAEFLLLSQSDQGFLMCQWSSNSMSDRVFPRRLVVAWDQSASIFALGHDKTVVYLRLSLDEDH